MHLTLTLTRACQMYVTITCRGSNVHFVLFEVLLVDCTDI